MKYIANKTVIRRHSGSEWKQNGSNETVILTKGQVYSEIEVAGMYPWYVESGYLTAV